MCIIVDANTAHEFGRALTEEALAIFEWLMRDGGTIAAGGRVKRELVKTRFRNIYHTLLLAGRLYQYDDDEVDRVEANVMAQLDLKIRRSSCDRAGTCFLVPAAVLERPGFARGLL